MEEDKINESIQPSYNDIDVQKGNINLNPFLLSNISVDVKAEATILNTAITQNTEEKEDSGTEGMTFGANVNELNAVISIEALKTVQSNQDIQIQKTDLVNKELTELKNQIKTIKTTYPQYITSELNSVYSNIATAIKNTQKFNEEFIPAESDKNYFFDLRLKETGQPPHWT